MAIFVTLVCAYFAAWEGTRAYLPKHPQALLLEVTSPIPFVIRETETESEMSSVGLSGISMRTRHTSRYYLWLLGPTLKLPFESGADNGDAIDWTKNLVG